MRPITTTICLFFAAVGGGLVVHALSLPPEPSPATQIVEAAAAITTPPVAEAALPTPTVNGAPIPSLAPMLEKVTPAVVNIYTKQVVRSRSISIEEFFRGVRVPQQRISQSLGSGVIVDAKRGLIITNYHVVEGADEVSVILNDGRTFEAQPIGSDADTDIAVIQIQAPNLVALPLADAKILRVGDFVVAVGNPFGLGQTVTSGIISAVGRSGLQGFGYQNFIQTDASINPGNSGGALVNLRGELVGINAASFNPQGSAAGNIGLGFAIPVNLASEIMRQIMAYGEVRRGSLGVDTIDITPEIATQLNLNNVRGALVARVFRGSPAEAAGLKPEDVITAINGQKIDSAIALHNSEGLLPVGQSVRVDALRAGKAMSVQTVLKAQAKEMDGGQLDPRLGGATLIDLPERYRSGGARGVIISKVAPKSRAERNGLEAGDRIAMMNRSQIRDLQDLRSALTTSPAQLSLGLQRGRQTGFLELR
jgi:serine protease DegQ